MHITFEVHHTNSSPEARQFAGQFWVANGRINPDVALGSQQAKNIERILEDLLGVEVLNGQLEMACTGSFPYDANTDIPCDDKMMIGRILLHHGTILRQFSEDYDPKADREATPTGYQRDLKDEERALAASQGLDTIDLSRVRIEHSPEALMRCDLDFLGEDALRA